MKIVLSRKGFDSSIQGGGSPSFVYKDRIYPLPIPEVGNGIEYEDLKFDEENSLLKVMRDLNINQFTECHFDPYISDKLLNDNSSIKKWERSLGQCDIAQSILANENIKQGDLFIFFGWFNRIDMNGKKFKYHPFKGHNKEGIQMIYGYLQIDKKINVNQTEKEVPNWVKSHPHYIQRKHFRGENVIYTAKENLSFDSSKPGAGLFKFKEDLILTQANLSRTNWILPNEFHPHSKIEIKYLPKKNWKPLGNGKVRVKASSRGQEFVVIKDGNKAIESWAKKLIDSHDVEK